MGLHHFHGVVCVNFNAYYLILFGKFKKAFAMEEVRWFFIIIFCSTAFIFFQILDSYSTAFEALTHAAFQVSTIITTTGFATTDFNLWPAASRTVLVLLMFIAPAQAAPVAASRYRAVSSWSRPLSRRWGPTFIRTA